LSVIGLDVQFSISTVHPAATRETAQIDNGDHALPFDTLPRVCPIEPRQFSRPLERNSLSLDGIPRITNCGPAPQTVKTGRIPRGISLEQASATEPYPRRARTNELTGVT
jgi:hypothetical protein